MTHRSSRTGIAAACTLACALALPVAAQETPPTDTATDTATVTAPVDQSVIDRAIDINSDGFYSYPELQIVLPGIAATDFTAMDSSGDGLLDAEEVAAALASGQLVLPQD